MKDNTGLPEAPAGLPPDARHEAAHLLHSVAVRLLRRARTADVGMDLDGPRASLLSVLVFAGPQTVSRLAEMEQVTAPAITRLVTALEADGLVARARTTEDRRVVRVVATDAGRRRLEGGRAARVRTIADLLDGVPDADLAALSSAARLLAARLPRPPTRPR